VNGTPSGDDDLYLGGKEGGEGSKGRDVHGVFAGCVFFSSPFIFVHIFLGFRAVFVIDLRPSLGAGVDSFFHAAGADLSLWSGDSSLSNSTWWFLSSQGRFCSFEVGISLF
jgi:hypothetical protein